MRAKDLATFATLTILVCVLFSVTNVTAEKKVVDLCSQVRSLDFAKAVPNQLSYQGFLTNAADSSAVTAALEMTFRLFDSETKGAELWSETHPAVEVQGGLFQVLLGSVTPFPEGLFEGATLWLQTEVGTEILSPRKPLVSVAYSQHSQLADHAMMSEEAAFAAETDHAVHADTAAYSPSASVWMVSGDDIYRETGKVGIGTASPLTELDVAGSVNATTYYGDGSNLTGISGTADADWTINGDTVYHEIGPVGIGTTSPTAPLTIQTVAGNEIYFPSTGNNAEIIAPISFNLGTSTGHSLGLLTNGQYRLLVSGTGDVGIGTITPGYKLDVNGDVNATAYYGDGSNLTGISGTADSDWTIAGDTIYHETGNVGIGTASPTAPLTIQAIPGTDVEFSSSGSNADMMSSAQFNIGTSGLQNLHLMTGALTRMCVTGTGQVGIGTTSPTQQLDVSGAVNATTYYGDGSNLTGISGTTDNDWTISGSDMYSGVSGNVGIGVLSPAKKLDIAGDVNLNREISEGIALWVNGDEALWYNGTYFSWGHGGTANYFANDVGIGTTSPVNTLDVEGGMAVGTNYSGTSTAPSNGMIVEGTVGIGTNSPSLTHKLEVSSSTGYSIYTAWNGASGGAAIYATNSGTGGDAIQATADGTGQSAIWASGSSGVDYGIYCYGNGATWSGYFSGNVNVTGTLSKGAGSFLIDHPLDPENKLLRHNFVESPNNFLIYAGKVTLDADGQAVVHMPDYYVALTKEDEASIHLTPVGRPFSVGAEWNPGFESFTAYGQANRDVYWEVLADRDDPVIRQLGKPVVEEKGPDNALCDKGELLYPTAYGYPASRGRDYQGLQNTKNSEQER